MASSGLIYSLLKNMLCIFGLLKYLKNDKARKRIFKTDQN